jgi:hypothetical protein
MGLGDLPASIDTPTPPLNETLQRVRGIRQRMLTCAYANSTYTEGDPKASEEERDASDAHERILVYEALSYQCMRPSATSVRGLTLLVYAAFRY